MSPVNNIILKEPAKFDDSDNLQGGEGFPGQDGQQGPGAHKGIESEYAALQGLNI